MSGTTVPKQVKVDLAAHIYEVLEAQLEHLGSYDITRIQKDGPSVYIHLRGKTGFTHTLHILIKEVF